MNLKRFFYVSVLLAFVMNIMNIYNFIVNASYIPANDIEYKKRTSIIGLEKNINSLEDLDNLKKDGNQNYPTFTCKKGFPTVNGISHIDEFIWGKMNNLFIPKFNNLFIAQANANDNSNIVNFKISLVLDKNTNGEIINEISYNINGETEIDWNYFYRFYNGVLALTVFSRANIIDYDNSKYALLKDDTFVYPKDKEVYFIKKEDFKKVISDLSYEEQVEAIQKYNPDLSCESLPSKGKITIYHIDYYTGEILHDKENYYNKVGENYNTNKKEIRNYEFVQVEGEESGEYIAGVKEIRYFYKKVPYEQRLGDVKIFYFDIDTFEEISPNDTITGKLDTDYQTQVKVLDNYEFVRVEGNENGIFTEDEQGVIYFYKKKEAPKTGKITVKYLEELTNKELSEEESFSGEINISYQTTKKEIQDYEFVKIEGNENGQYSENKQIITYFYKKKEVKISTGTGITTGRTFKSGIDHKYNPETENYKIPEKPREKRVYNLINNESPKVEEKVQEKEVSIPEKPKIENNTKTKIEKQKEIKEKIQEIKENKTQTKIIKFPKKLPKTGADFRELFENKFDFN